MSHRRWRQSVAPGVRPGLHSAAIFDGWLSRFSPQHVYCYYLRFERKGIMSTEAPALELKKTINLPKTKFAQKANLAQSEPVRLKQWAEQDLYQQIRRARAGAEKFIL